MSFNCGRNKWKWKKIQTLIFLGPVLFEWTKSVLMQCPFIYLLSWGAQIPPDIGQRQGHGIQRHTFTHMDNFESPINLASLEGGRISEYPEHGKNIQTPFRKPWPMIKPRKLWGASVNHFMCCTEWYCTVMCKIHSEVWLNRQSAAGERNLFRCLYTQRKLKLSQNECNNLYSSISYRLCPLLDSMSTVLKPEKWPSSQDQYQPTVEPVVHVTWTFTLWID